jgi:hypothetical protein
VGKGGETTLLSQPRGSNISASKAGIAWRKSGETTLQFVSQISRMVAKKYAAKGVLLTKVSGDRLTLLVGKLKPSRKPSSNEPTRNHNGPPLSARSASAAAPSKDPTTTDSHFDDVMDGGDHGGAFFLVKLLSELFKALSSGECGTEIFETRSWLGYGMGVPAVMGTGDGMRFDYVCASMLRSFQMLDAASWGRPHSVIAESKLVRRVLLSIAPSHLANYDECPSSPLFCLLVGRHRKDITASVTTGEGSSDTSESNRAEHDGGGEDEEDRADTTTLIEPVCQEPSARDDMCVWMLASPSFRFKLRGLSAESVRFLSFGPRMTLSWPSPAADRCDSAMTLSNNQCVDLSSAVPPF